MDSIHELLTQKLEKEDWKVGGWKNKSGERFENEISIKSVARGQEGESEKKGRGKGEFDFMCFALLKPNLRWKDSAYRGNQK